jgi:YHS domain-containing protein
MVRLVLILLLIVFIARAFWRVIDGVLMGMRNGPSPSRPPSQQASRTGVQMARDPVCGTFVIPERAVRLDDGTRVIHFCSTECRDAFRARTA